MERRGRICKQLLDNLEKMRGRCKLKEEALNRAVWRICFGVGYGTVVSWNRKWMNVQTGTSLSRAACYLPVTQQNVVSNLLKLTESVLCCLSSIHTRT